MDVELHKKIHLPLFFTALAKGNNKVIWLSVFAACTCYVPTGDMRETSINAVNKLFYMWI